jgi:hypothetical protein
MAKGFEEIARAYNPNNILQLNGFLETLYKDIYDLRNDFEVLA